MTERCDDKDTHPFVVKDTYTADEVARIVDEVRTMDAVESSDDNRSNLTSQQRTVFDALTEPTTARRLTYALALKGTWYYDHVYGMLKTLERKGLVVRDGKIRDHYAVAPQWLWRRTESSDRKENP